VLERVQVQVLVLVLQPALQELQELQELVLVLVLP
jgi:hypothetical protein